MNTLTNILIAAAGFVVAPTGLSEATTSSAVAVHCASAVKPSVPAEYLFYHSLVAPQAALAPRNNVQASCPPRKVIRT